MPVDNFRDLHAFFIVARERNFTRAATELGLSQSALSHKIRGLETKLGVRLLTRTTRSVSPTEAGERLMRLVAPRFDVISGVMDVLSAQANGPSGTVRIKTSDFAASTVLWPKLASVHRTYPAIKIDLVIDSTAVDSAHERFDAIVQFGSTTTKNRCAIPISRDVGMMIVGSPDYFLERPQPAVPADLMNHTCFGLREGGQGDSDTWELLFDDALRRVPVQAAWTFNSFPYVANAALSGHGLGLVPEALVRGAIADGRLLPVLERHWPTLPPLHVAHDINEPLSGALSVVVDTLRIK